MYLFIQKRGPGSLTGRGEGFGSEMLALGFPFCAGEPLVDDFVVAGDVSGDAVFGCAEGVGVFAVLVDDGFGGTAGGVDEADFAVVLNDEEGDVPVEADDSDAGSA